MILWESLSASGVPLFYREEGLTSTNMHKETVVFRTWKRSAIKIFYPNYLPRAEGGQSAWGGHAVFGSGSIPWVSLRMK